MSTRTPTGRLIEVPHLAGDKAEQAIQRLRELGLMPVTWSAEVDDVNRAGFVLGLDPPAGAQVRPKASITISVATHPDFKGHVEDEIPARLDHPVQPPLTWPLSSPTGCATEAPSAPPEARTDSSATSAAPDAPSAPASSPIDAASRETRHLDAAASSAVPPTSGAAADPSLREPSGTVPTPDEISADAEWDRLRAAEATRHAAGVEDSASRLSTPSADSTDEAPAPESADALEEQARREARKRQARRRRHLTLKQKAIVVGLLAFTLLIAVAALSGHQPTVGALRSAHVAPHTTNQRARSSAGPELHRQKRHRVTRARTHHTKVRHHAASPHRRPRRTARNRRASDARRATHVRVTTVTVQAPAPTIPAATTSAPAVPVSAPPSSAAPSNSGAGSPTSSAPPSAPPAASAPVHQPASSSTSESGSSGTGGGTTLQSPDGTTAPPKP